MSSNVQLKTITCPNCGDKLKYEKVGETVICMSCESSIVIKGEENKTQENVKKSKIDEIKTSSTALAYIEQFLEEYDWDSFVFDYDFSIEELDGLVNTLKITAADDYRTWMAAFTCLVVPFEKKIEYRKKALESLIEEFKNKNLDAYGMYDAYKNVAKAIVSKFNEIKEQATKIIGYAEKYGASDEIVNKFKQQLNELNVSEIANSIFDNIEDVPEVVKFKEEEQNKIVLELLQKGIDAEAYYLSAIDYKNQGEYKLAIEKLVSIRGYKDAEKQIEEMENNFVFSNVMFVKDKYYYLAKEEESATSDAFEVENFAPKNKPTIKNISKIIKIYANSVYYSTDKELRLYDFTTKKDTVLYNGKVVDHKFDLYNQAIYLVCSEGDGYESKYSLNKLSLVDQTFTACEKEISKIYGFIDGYCAFEKRNNDVTEKVKSVHIYDLLNNKPYCIGKTTVFICGYIGNNVVFTKNNPDDYNKNLYALKLEEEGAKPILLEANIIGLPQVLEGKIYYYTLDNLDNKILISINIDGTNRKELATYVDKILFVSGKWIYFKRTYRHNTALCKVKTTGSKVEVIATQIDEFIKIESGYLYYISDSRSMHKVRIDGTKKKTLCYAVEKVLVAKDNKIVFIALDRLVKNGIDDEVYTKKYLKSIYAIDFNSQGKRKAVYNITAAFNMGDDVFFTKNEKEKIGEEENNQKVLYKLNINDYSVEKITKLKVPEKTGCYVATCVYGSYDCPEVWTLRRYRDNTLGSTWYGRVFIRMYYAISPTIVKWFGRTKWFKNIWKKKLDKMVEKLNKSGVDNTPYQDKEW